MHPEITKNENMAEEKIREMLAQLVKPSPYITREEVAEMLHVCKQTVINYTKNGLLTAHKVGRRVLYKVEEVEAAVQAQTVYRYKHN